MMKIVKTCLLLVLLWMVIPAFAQSEVMVTAKQNLALQSQPNYDSEVLGVFLRGQEATAFGRNEAGSWLHLSDGWVAAKNVAADGDMMKLPVTTDAVTLRAADSRSLRSGPDESFDVSGSLPSGETMIALGRNADGSWLQVSSGWIPAGEVEILGDVMGLPLTFAGFIIRANYNVALHHAPSRDAEVRAILGRGEEAIAIGRDEDGTAVQTTKGWVFVSRGLRLEGDMTELPIVPGVTLTATQALTLYSRPGLNFDRLDVLEGGEEAIAFGRDEAGAWLQISGGWASIEQGLEISGSVMDLPITGYADIKITATMTSSVRSEPITGVSFIRTLRIGEEAIAIGRNKDGKWLRIEDGWVYASFYEVDGDIMSLPIIGSASIKIIATRGISTAVRSEPRFGEDVNVIKRLRIGEEAIAIGRNKDGSWLRIEDGWVYAASYEVDGDIMDLPVVAGAASAISSNTSTGRATPMPAPTSAPAFSESAIRSLVSRYTDDIRILKITQQGSTTAIEYDLKSWPFVPNEIIAEEVTFKVICALDKGERIPHKLEFIGQANFTSDVGRKFKSPSVEIHISASNANRIVCSGNDYTDINWRGISSLYKSYPIPSGASVDYD